MYCTNCGTNVDENKSKFCTQCGQKLHENPYAFADNCEKVKQERYGENQGTADINMSGYNSLSNKNSINENENEEMRDLTNINVFQSSFDNVNKQLLSNVGNNNDRGYQSNIDRLAENKSPNGYDYKKEESTREYNKANAEVKNINYGYRTQASSRDYNTPNTEEKFSFHKAKNAVVLTIFCIFLAGLVICFCYAISDSNGNNKLKISSYESIYVGLTYTEVVKIVGTPTSDYSVYSDNWFTDETKHCEWKTTVNNKVRIMKVVFKDDIVISKSKTGSW